MTKQSCGQKPQDSPQIGIYFYPWYNEARWREFARPFTPAIGLYDSRDRAAIDWQLDHIAAAGIDYVVFEIVPRHDWCFETMAESIDLALAGLRARGLGWTFMVDTKCNPGPESTLHDVFESIAQIEAYGWARELVSGPSGRPLMIVFAPFLDEAAAITARLGQQYELVYPGWLPHWGHADDRTDFELLAPYCREAKALGVTLFEHLEPRGYIGFWESTPEVHNFGGFCSVTPGYDDLLLKRDPQLAPMVPRESGRHYERQFEQAIAKQAKHILIYGWNEYFEGTTIEPTLEYGLQYVELTRRLIEKHAPRSRTLPAWPPKAWDAGASEAIAQPRLFEGVQPLAGFYSPEHDAEGQTVWTEQSFRLGRLGSATRLSLHVCYNGLNGKLHLSGRRGEARSLQLTQGWQRQILDLSDFAPGDLSFQVDPVTSAAGDSRTLGIRIRSARAA